MNKPHLWQIYTNVRYFCMVYSITELRIIKQRTFVHREATHVHIYWQNKAFLESIGVCRLSLTILALLYPTLPLCHFVPSFSGGVSNSCVSSRLRLPPSRLGNIPEQTSEHHGVLKTYMSIFKVWTDNIVYMFVRC